MTTAVAFRLSSERQKEVSYKSDLFIPSLLLFIQHFLNKSTLILGDQIVEVFAQYVSSVNCIQYCTSNHMLTP